MRGFRNEESICRIERARNADDGDRVAGEDEAVGSEVSGVFRSIGAEPDPNRERTEKEDTFLGEERDQEQRASGADESADDAVEALRQHEPALRLGNDEDCERRPFWLIEIKGKGD